jgi:hypothetical protein
MNIEFEFQSVITSPPHYVDGRTIEPITVIEVFGLCHHLACVVKYIARAGRKNPILEDLRKAEWYLDRAATNKSTCQNDEVIPQQVSSGSLLISLPQIICDDWQLSDSLCSTILNIFLSKNLHSHVSKERALNSALDCLREEISIQEMLQDSKLPVKRESEFKDIINKMVNPFLKKPEKDRPIQFSEKEARVA